MIKLGYRSYSSEMYKSSEEIDLVVGNYSSIASHLRLITGEHPSAVHREAVANFPLEEKCDYIYYQCQYKNTIKVGNDVWIGERVTLRGGITIGDGAIIGMGAVVTKDVPPFAVAVGNPIQIKRFRFTQEQIDELLKIKWWDWSDEEVKTAAPYMKDIDTFLSWTKEKYGREANKIS